MPASSGSTARVAPRSAKAALQAGIATVYQEVNLLPNLSVAQNLFLGRQPMRFGIVREGEMRRRAKALLTDFGLDIDVAAPLGSYSVAVQHVTAIARAVDLSARVLILDEPTASLDRHEVEILFGIMRQLAKRGIGIVFVSHFLDQVYEISDRITVLRNGRLVGERETASLPRLELIRMMLGRELAETTSARASAGRASGARGLSRVSRTTARPAMSRRSISSCAMARSWASPACSARAAPRRRGWCSAPSAPMAGRRGWRARPCGCSRRATACATALAIARRTARPTASSPSSPCARTSCWRSRPSAACTGRCRAASRTRSQSRYVKVLDIRPPDPETPVGLLSGGNQQKVLLARWLATSPRLLMLDEPTRGIDVGAHAEIIRLIRELCDDGLALLVISSELDEIVTYSDRVVVLRDRAHVEELAGEAIDVGNILAAIAADGAAVAHEAPGMTRCCRAAALPRSSR